jgi:hypothetical protein
MENDSVDVNTQVGDNIEIRRCCRRLFLYDACTEH